MKKLWDIIQRPLRCEPLLFASLCAVLCLTLFSTIYCGFTGLGTLVANIFFAYLATAVVSLFPSYAAMVLRWLLIVYSAAMSLFVFFGAIFIKTPTAMNTLMLILQTNAEEAGGFFRYYVHAKEVLMTIVAIAVCSGIGYGIFRLIKGSCRGAEYLRRTIACGSLLSVPVMCLLPLNVLQTVPQLEICFTHIDIVFHPHDLREYARKEAMTETNHAHAKNVVLILGESHHRSHCSLTGYSRPTNPELQQLVDSGNLFVFDSVVAPAAYTGLSLRSMLSTYGHHMREEEQGCDWWECQTIPTTFKALGYETYWITNQKGGAVRDAVADSYARLCDHTISTSGRGCLDGELLPLVKEAKEASKGNCLFIIHLMGSHEAFDQRFPGEFSHFKAEDYPELPANQRQTVADYDNSLLYNDFIVDRILEMFSDESTLAVYCPDHALDLYMIDPDYAAHAKADVQSQKVAREIPLFVYLSDGLKMQNDNLSDTLEAKLHKRYNSENLIYMMTQLDGYEFANRTK